MCLSFTVPRISILLFHITTNLPTTTSSGQQFTTTDITYYQPEPLYSNQTVLIYDDNRDLVTKIGPKKLILNEKQQSSQTNTFSQIPGENCGNPESPFRVIGGSEAYEGEYPWMVRLQPCQCESENCENYSSCFTCGGSMISKDFILTAAHCVDLESNGKFGFWNLFFGDLRERVAESTERAGARVLEPGGRNRNGKRAIHAFPGSAAPQDRSTELWTRTMIGKRFA